ncbi:hypothetical protein BBP40_007635 [Aspergillus hancockii]|nr:hypothetical protein BBP40_007635 [Aspergillus hancockii]
MAPSNRQTAMMDEARKSATFDSEKLTRIIFDGEENLESRRAAFHRVESALDLLDNMKLPVIYDGSEREELYRQGVRRGRVVTGDMLEHGHRHFETITERHQLSISTTFGLHFLMFRKTVELQATPEQKAYWLPLIDDLKVTGAYAQTELSHGTFVRGIETTATFDPTTDEFIIDSPTLTSTKYWPGGLGFTASHSVVVARLLIGGVDHGLHMFIVQLRSLDDWTPIPGTELGDIGLKMTSNGTDNGYAHFTGVRIPRSGLLAANAEVLPDGTYVRKGGAIDGGHYKKTYATLLYVRGVIARQVSFSLAQAATIAARYSVVREQGYGMFANETELKHESAIIAFKSQHYRLLTVLSQAYATFFMSNSFDQHYKTLMQDQADNDYKRLPFTHALSTGLKAWSTNIAAAGVEDARRLAGGHGCMAIAGLGEIVGAVGAAATYEGENYAMWQQLGRFLVKSVQALEAGKPVAPEIESILGEGFDVYLRGENANTKYTVDEKELLEPSSLLHIFLHRTRRLLVAAYRYFEQQLKDTSISDAWNASMMPIISVANAYTEYMVVQSFQERVATIAATEPTVSPVLDRLCRLFALTTIVSPTVSSFNAASFVEDGYLSLSQLDQMRASIDETLVQLLPDVIALTDAWDFTDASLTSALGCKDGNVYERLMSWTRQLPINVHAAEQGGKLPRVWEGPEGLEEFLKRDRTQGK